MAVLEVRPPGGPPVTLFVACRYRHRLLGLAGLRALAPGYGLLIPCCSAIHTFGMRFAIDVLFVRRTATGFDLIDRRNAVRPRRLARTAAPGVSVIELPSAFGDRLAATRLDAQHAPDALGHPPVPVADQLHSGRHQHRPHDRRVEEDRHGESHSELL